MKKLTLLLAMLAGPLAAADITHGDLVITEARTFATAPMARAAGGYLTIENTGDTDDVLIGASSDLPRTEIHLSFEDDGVMRMQHVPRLDVPAGETLQLSPGGYHVMFMGLTEPFEPGDEVPVTLVFEQAGEVEVVMSVVPRGAGTGNGHGMGNGHGN